MGTEGLHERARTVSSRQDMLLFLEELVTSFTAYPDDWQIPELEAFLVRIADEAESRHTASADHEGLSEGEPTWRYMAELLLAALDDHTNPAIGSVTSRPSRSKSPTTQESVDLVDLLDEVSDCAGFVMYVRVLAEDFMTNRDEWQNWVTPLYLDVTQTALGEARNDPFELHEGTHKGQPNWECLANLFGAGRVWE